MIAKRLGLPPRGGEAVKLVGSHMLAVLVRAGLLRREQDGDYCLTPAGESIVGTLRRYQRDAVGVPAYREIRRAGKRRA